MLEGKLIIIPALGHQNKGKSNFTGSDLFVLMSQCGNNNELALQHGGFCTTRTKSPLVVVFLSYKMIFIYKTIIFPPLKTTVIAYIIYLQDNYFPPFEDDSNRVYYN